VLGFILYLVVVGFLAGLIARAIMPGRDPMSIGATMLLGIVGSFVGGFLADLFTRGEYETAGLHPAGIIGSIVGAVAVLALWRMVQGRRHHHHAL
jgi:uncharacterized membrane protein YeaQ/YmgE (transglycosylase-associated protein family)